jgi:hypothetical protein
MLQRENLISRATRKICCTTLTTQATTRNNRISEPATKGTTEQKEERPDTQHNVGTSNKKEQQPKANKER